MLAVLPLPLCRLYIVIVVTPLTALMKDPVKRNLFNFCANYIVSTPEPLQRAPPKAILHNLSLEYAVFLTLILCEGQAMHALYKQHDKPHACFG